MPGIDDSVSQSSHLLAGAREDLDRADAEPVGSLAEATLRLKALRRLRLSTGRQLDAIDQEVARWEQRRAELSGEVQ